MKIKTVFERTFSELLIEYILFERDRNLDKTYWHIRWWSTIYSYYRKNKKLYFIPEEYKDSLNTWIFEIRATFWKYTFTSEEKYFVEKYKIYSIKNFLNTFIDPQDEYIFPFLSMISRWYQSIFEKKIIEWFKFTEEYLYDFLLWISDDTHQSYNYYFRFSESLNFQDFENIVQSIHQNNEYLFSYVAAASYLFHNGKKQEALQYYNAAIKIDPKNPYILWKIAILLNSLSQYEHSIKAETILLEIIQTQKAAPWMYQYLFEVQVSLGKYYEVIEKFWIYEKLTQNKHKTFEPYLRLAQSYMEIWVFSQARYYLNFEKKYYFWEGYRFVYNQIDTQLKELGY